MLYVPGQGDEKMLSRDAGNPHRPTDGYTYNIVTKSNWQFRCISLVASQASQGEGFLAIAPNGTTYRFDWMVSRSALGMGSSVGLISRREVWILPTLVTDRFGNTVTYNYDTTDPWKLTSIVASDGRSLSLTYVTGTHRVASVTDGTRTWTYTYTPTAPGSSIQRLTRVQQPDGSAWTFAMAEQQSPMAPSATGGNTCSGSTWIPQPAPLPEQRISTITHPSGAVGSFTLQNVMHGRSNFSANPCPFLQGTTSHDGPTPEFPVRSIVAKSLSGPGMSGPTAGARPMRAGDVAARPAPAPRR